MLLALVELDSIESNALVAKGKLLLCLKSIENDAGGQIEARLVAMGTLFDATLRCTTCGHLSRHAAYPRERRRTDG